MNTRRDPTGGDTERLAEVLHFFTERADLFGGYECACGASWLTDGCSRGGIEEQWEQAQAVAAYAAEVAVRARRDAVMGFVRYVATNAAYNGAPDPGQQFYDWCLNSWLYDTAEHYLDREAAAHTPPETDWPLVAVLRSDETREALAEALEEWGRERAGLGTLPGGDMADVALAMLGGRLGVPS